MRSIYDVGNFLIRIYSLPFTVNQVKESQIGKKKTVQWSGSFYRFHSIKLDSRTILIVMQNNLLH